MSTSDREVITYMADDDYDLPRWASNTGPGHTPLHALQSAQNHYHNPLYSGQQAPPQQQPSSNARPPPRVSHPSDDDVPNSMLSNIARSASLSTAAGRAGVTGGVRRQGQPDDIERAASYAGENRATTASRAAGGQMPNPFYPSSVAYQQSAASNQGVGAGAGATAQTPVETGYNMYYPSGAQSQQQQQQQAQTGAKGAGQNAAPQSSQMDPYGQQAGQQYGSTNYGDYSHSHSHPPSAASTQDTDMRASPYVPQQSQPQQRMSSPYTSSTSFPQMDTHHQHQLSVATPSTRPPSHSNPATPFSMHSGYYTPSQTEAMNVEAPPLRRRSLGFKRVRDPRELRSFVNPQPQGRRVDQSGVSVGPLRALTSEITTTYNLCNKQFRYETSHNPRRVLTKPSRPVHNDGYDNEDYDYILYVNDYLGSEDGQKYLILDVLGQGTFGQVVKCQNVKTGEILAVKVIKNKPAYFNQSMMEVTILQMLNNDYDPSDEHHILRLRDSFIHRNHLCLVFEQLSSNLYELIKQNQFQGLSTQLVKVFTAQLLDALTVLKEARLIHCDLKPENILLKSLQSPQIKVIDFGSACHERQTVYTYIQSRFYRSPEVLLGLPYTAAIDIWSLGCIVVELFLGLPLFPGTSEYNQITRIVDLLGLPPQHMLENGKQTSQFFDRYVDAYGQTKFRLKSIEQYSRERNTQEQPGKQYFNHKTLPEIIRHAPLASSRHQSSSRQAQEMERENNNRAAFIDFCQGLLNMDPLTRWTPQQAKMHPFITGEKFVRPFNPHAITPSNTPHISSTPAAADPKRPYGGLISSQPKGSRAYQDAASYNQQLAQHQAYTAQAQAQAASGNPMRNPYMQPGQSYQDPNADYNAQQQSQQQQQVAAAAAAQSAQTSAALSAAAAANRQLAHHASAGSLGVQYGGQPGSATNPHPPASSYYPNARNRSNTINQIDVVPPALARLQQMNNPDAVGRNALTPVMQREDAMREWERRQSGKGNPPPAHSYPQLEYLEMAASGMNWTGAGASSRAYAPSNLSFQSQPATTLADQDRQNVNMRDAVMSSVRSAARGDPASNNSLTQAGVISAPPQAYTGGTANTGNRFGTAAYSQNSSSYDTSVYDNRNDSSSLYMPMQAAQQYQPYGNNMAGSSAHPQSQSQPQQRLNIPQSPQTGNTSFYSAGVVPSGQPFTTQSSPSIPQQSLPNNARRLSGMDVWQR